MPVTLVPMNRREWLRGAAALGAGLWLGGATRGVAGVEQDGAKGGAGAVDPHRFALFSDTHIWAKRDEVVRGVAMAKNLKQACDESLSGDGARPAAAMICGDCAYLTGEPGDYAVLVELLQPLRKAGVPVHMAMGNHDQRANFWKAFSPAEGAKMLVDQRQVSIVPSPRANWFVLDSLDVTNKTPGVCGEKQLAWLSQALDQHADKPAIVMVHHNPDEREQPSGLVDTAALYAALESRKHVKALFFGHTHNWSVTERKGLHLINLPPTAYVFGEGKPNGWVDVQLLEGGMKLQLRCLDANHALHNKTHDLRWT